MPDEVRRPTTRRSTTTGPSTDPQLTARLVGELHELLALDIDESDYALAVAELGMEVDPPAAVLTQRLARTGRRPADRAACRRHRDRLTHPSGPRTRNR
ncbi:contact-dependent growth inhibition system immunity protein [Streptomyces sp. L7]